MVSAPSRGRRFGPTGEREAELGRTRSGAPESPQFLEFIEDRLTVDHSRDRDYIERLKLPSGATSTKQRQRAAPATEVGSWSPEHERNRRSMGREAQFGALTARSPFTPLPPTPPRRQSPRVPATPRPTPSVRAADRIRSRNQLQQRNRAGI